MNGSAYTYIYIQIGAISFVWKRCLTDLSINYCSNLERVTVLVG